MAHIAPFKGLTYNYHVRKDFELMVAPPYDVISEDEQEEYYQQDPYNVIRLILGKKKTGDSDWDNRYTRAADYFKRWESAGILLSEETPCIYVTSLTYNPGNKSPSLTRWGIIALVRIEEEDSAIILPHERTFSAHRDDRLKLIRACNAQFSQVFGLYEDPDNSVMNICRQNIHYDPRIAFELDDGTRHKMWALRNPRLFKDVANAMLNKSILIADGHHRYETARNFRNLMRARYGQRPNRSYEYVMMYLTNMSDEGLTILPSHRLIKRVPNFQLEPFLEKLSRWFRIKGFPFPGADIPNECIDLKKRLELAGEADSVIAFYHHNAPSYFLLSLEPAAREEMGDDLHPSLKKLDVLVLSRFIFQKTLGFSKEDLDNEEVFHYQSNTQTAVTDVRAGRYQMAFLLNSTKIEHVKEIAGNSLVMPRKSTYFYPKVITGLVFNKIDPYEIIQAP